MIKIFKKAISILVLAAFVLSLMPLGVMAEVENENIVTNFESLINWAATRDNGSKPGPTNYTGTSDYGYSINASTGSNDRRVYYQLDLAGYEEILENEGTSVSITIKSKSSSASYSLKNFDIYAMDDTTDFYATEYDSAAAPLYEGDTGIRLTHAQAANAGLHDYTGKGILLASRSDAATTSYTYDAATESLATQLRTGTDNSVVTISMKGTSGAGYIYPTMVGVGATITYNKTKIDNQAYVNSITDEFSWADISEQDISSVANDLTLPASYRGADITWSSSNTGSIANDGTVTNLTEDKTVTLTATLSYKGVEESAQIGTATKDFTVTVAAETPIEVRIPFTNYGNARDDKTVCQEYSVNSSYSSIHYVGTGGIWEAYAQFDLSDYEEILRNPNTTAEFRIKAGNGFTQSQAYDFKVYLAADSVDSYKYDEIYWKQAKDMGMYNTERPILFERTDTTKAGNGTLFTGDANMTGLLSTLSESDTNGVVTMWFDGASGTTFRINDAAGGLFISYYESEIDNAKHSEDIQKEFIWENLTSDSADAVENNLSSYFRGAAVTWSADEDGVILSDGTIVKIKDIDRDVKLTATVDYKGNVFTKDFDVTIAGEQMKSVVIPLESGTYVTKNSSANPQGPYNTSYYSRYMYPVGLYGNGNDRVVFLKWDFTDYIDKLAVAQGMSMNLISVEKYTQSGGITRLSVLPDGYESWTEADLCYDSAADMGLYTAPAVYAVECAPISSSCEITSSGEFLDAIKKSISDNPVNGTVNFKWEATSSSVTAYRLSDNNKNHFTITLYYYESDVVSGDDFVNSKVESMPWSYVSQQDQKSVVADLALPKTFYGVPVEWASSDESIITSSGEVIAGAADANVKLTATVNGISKDFDVKVSSKNFVVKTSTSNENGTISAANHTNAYLYANKDAGTIPALIVATYSDGVLKEITIKENYEIKKGENFIFSGTHYAAPANTEVKVLFMGNLENVAPMYDVNNK